MIEDPSKSVITNNSNPHEQVFGLQVSEPHGSHPGIRPEEGQRNANCIQRPVLNGGLVQGCSSSLVGGRIGRH